MIYAEATPEAATHTIAPAPAATSAAVAEQTAARNLGGRPSVAATAADSTRVSVVIADDDLAALDNRAAMMGTTRSALIRRSVQAWLAQEPTADSRTWSARKASGDDIAISGRTLREAVERHSREIIGVANYHLVEVTLSPGVGTIGGRTYAELAVTWTRNTGIPERDTGAEQHTTAEIFAAPKDIPEPITLYPTA